MWYFLHQTGKHYVSFFDEFNNYLQIWNIDYYLFAILCLRRLVITLSSHDSKCLNRNWILYIFFIYHKWYDHESKYFCMLFNKTVFIIIYYINVFVIVVNNLSSSCFVLFIVISHRHNLTFSKLECFNFENMHWGSSKRQPNL